MTKKISRVGVIGAGTMGSAIAQHFSMKGVQVRLMDTNPAGLEKGMSGIRQSIEEAKARKVMSEGDAQAALSRLQTTSKLEDLKDCELVLEAVFENLEVKRTLFASLEQIIPSTCILATNTSSLLVTDIAANLKNPERVVGVHYFYHAAKNKLVEIIPGKKTSEAYVKQLWNFYTSCDKTPIYSKDAPGFVVNRFFVPWLNEANRLYEEGLGSIAFIDGMAKDVFKVGMGPFALMNATGVPIALHAANCLAEKLGDFYKPAVILKTQVDSKQNWNVDSTALLKNFANDAVAVKERLLMSVWGPALALVEEGVSDYSSLDLGARVGLRWPKGPIEMLNQYGVEKAKDLLAKYLRPYKLPVPKIATNSQGKVALEWMQKEVSGSTGFITFNIPDRMNPLSEESVAQLAEHFDAFDKDSKIQAIVIRGTGKAFVAGADVKFFVDCMYRDDLKRIYNFTKFGQDLLTRIANSKKKTVAYLNGLTLGGGLELALACHYRVAATKAILAFPETGIGIYPGLGGTQRAPRLIGRGLAKYLIATGQFVDAKTALKYGLVDEVIDPPAHLEEALSHLELSHRKASDKFAEEAFENYTGTLTDELSNLEVFKKSEKGLSRKAPWALKKSMELIDQGMGLSLEKGLQLELDSLMKVFSSHDAKAGLSSLLLKAKPTFKGL